MSPQDAKQRASQQKLKPGVTERVLSKPLPFADAAEESLFGTRNTLAKRQILPIIRDDEISLFGTRGIQTGPEDATSVGDDETSLFSIRDIQTAPQDAPSVGDDELSLCGNSLEAAWPTGFCLDQTAEGQIKRLMDTTLSQRSNKSTPLPPEQVKLGSDYEVLALIGQGGMGYVYKVKDKRKNQVVAVKIVRQELATDPRALKRFEQEAEAAMGLIHPNLVPVYAQGMTGDGAPYLVMEYQEGTPLDKVLKQERCIKPDRAVDICMQICDALAHAHAKGIVHRDLKPSNIVITKTKGNKDVVRIVDFGIAKVLASPESRQSIELTHTGDLFGSPSYMSPEQCMGYQLDARSDIYSLGCVMYELLSGQPPFICDNPVQTIVKHLSELPERLNRPDLASSEIPTSLASLVLRCLEKDPRNRYQSMEQLRKDLSNIQTGQRPLYARAHERASNSQPLPLVAKISVIVLIDLFCLSAAFQHYEQEVQSVADGQQAIVESGRPSGVFSDALANLRAFCATRDQFFEQRYESLTEQLPVDLYRLRSRAPHDYEYQNLVEIASEKANDGLKLLREYKTLAVDQSTNPRATENSSTAATFYTALQARQDQWLDSIASDLEKDMRNVTAEAKLHIAGSPVATSRGWLIGEVLALMLFNVMLVLGLVKSLGAETKKRTWKIGDKSF